MNEELMEMLDRYRDGELTDAEIVELRNLLKSDPALRQDLVREQLMEAAFELEMEGGLESPVDVPETIPFSKPRFRFPWGWAAAAVILFGIGLGSGHRFSGGSRELVTAELEDDGIAILSETVDAVWEADADPGEGEILSPGKLNLTSGLAQIEFYSGARLVLEGPVELELVSSNHAICLDGKLRAFVPPHARGFTVVSPHFELVDLGTEFGIDVSKSGDATVHVFDGEVELYPPNGKRSADQLKRLNKGNGLNFDSQGKTVATAEAPKNFPSFHDVRKKTKEAEKARFESWKHWNEDIRSDPRVTAYYDFESGEGSQLLDKSPGNANGTIIGGEWNRGRWPGKGALEFKRPGDRVRLNIPGEFDAVTLSAWIRMDAQTGRWQSLLLTDSYEIGKVHWQISKEGNLRFGTRLPSDSKNVMASGYSSPVLFTPRRIGTWSFVTTVFDRQAKEVSHFINGREVSREKITFDQSLQFGPAEIGNWGVPFRPKKNSHSIRNFVGRIDEMTIWKTALSNEEIRGIYRQTRP